MNILHRTLDTEKTRSSYANVAWFYNFWSWLTESKAARLVIRLADIKDHQKILEVACGTGAVFEQIVKHNPNGENLGIDLSPDMLGKTKQRMQRMKSSSYALREGDVLNLDLPDNNYDIVINNFMIDLMPEDTFDKILSEFYRLLKPNGVAVISIFTAGKKKINKFWVWIAKSFPNLLTGCRPVIIYENLIRAGFTIEEDIDLSQNTFPSKVIKARKTISN